MNIELSKCSSFITFRDSLCLLQILPNFSAQFVNPFWRMHFPEGIATLDWALGEKKADILCSMFFENTHRAAWQLTIPKSLDSQLKQWLLITKKMEFYHIEPHNSELLWGSHKQNYETLKAESEYAQQNEVGYVNQVEIRENRGDDIQKNIGQNKLKHSQSRRGLKNLYEWGTLKQIYYLNQIEKYQSISSKEHSLGRQKRARLQEQQQMFREISVKLGRCIMSQLRREMYVASETVTVKILQRHGLNYRPSWNFSKNYAIILTEKQLDQQKNYRQALSLFFTLKIAYSVRDLQGTCAYLGLLKTLLLDRRSGVLVGQYDTWQMLYETTLKLYCRYQQVRSQQMLQVDQLLSQPYSDSEFQSFLLKNIANAQVSLSSVNFYLRNASWRQREQLRAAVMQKVQRMMECECWSRGEEISEFLNELSGQERSSLHEKIINKLCGMPLSEITQRDVYNVQRGVTCFVRILMQHMNQQTIDQLLSLTMLENMLSIARSYSSAKKQTQQTTSVQKATIQTAYAKKTITQTTSVKGHLAQSSFDQASSRSLICFWLFDELLRQLYLQTEYQNWRLPSLHWLIKTAAAFAETGYICSKPALMFLYYFLARQAPQFLHHKHPNANFRQGAEGKIMQGIVRQFTDVNVLMGLIAKLYLGGSYQQNVDLEIVHSVQQNRQLLQRHIQSCLQSLINDQLLQQRQVKKCLQTDLHDVLGTSSSRAKINRLRASYLAVKCFKQQSIFRSILNISVVFGDGTLGLQPLQTAFLHSLPIGYIEPWTPQEQFSSVLSVVCQQHPIEVLKLVFRQLCDDWGVDWAVLETLSPRFWSSYFFPHDCRELCMLGEGVSCEALQAVQYLRRFQCVVNLANCVFDKLNEQSQKSIKEIRLIYQQGCGKAIEVAQQLSALWLQAVTEDLFMETEALSEEQVKQLQLFRSRSRPQAHNNREPGSQIHSLILERYLKRNSLVSALHLFQNIGKVLAHPLKDQCLNALIPCFNNKSNIILRPFPSNINNLISRRNVDGLVDICYFLEIPFLARLIQPDPHASSIPIQFRKEWIDYILLQFEQLRYDLSGWQGMTALGGLCVEQMRRVLSSWVLPEVLRQVIRASHKARDDDEGYDSRVNLLKLMKQSLRMLQSIDSEQEDHFVVLFQTLQEEMLAAYKQIDQEIDKNDKQKQMQRRNSSIQRDILATTRQIAVSVLSCLAMFIDLAREGIKIRSYHLFKMARHYLKLSSQPPQHLNYVIVQQINHLLQQFVGNFNPLPQLTKNCSQQRQLPSIYNSLIKSQSVSPSYLTKIRQECKRDCDQQIRPDIEKQYRPEIQKQYRPKIQKQYRPETEKQCSPDIRQKSSPDIRQKSRRDIRQKSRRETGQLRGAERKLGVVENACTLSMFINLFCRLNYVSLTTGIEQILLDQSARVVYLDYLIVLAQSFIDHQPVLSERDREVLRVDVLGNLTYVARGMLSERVLTRLVLLAKKLLWVRVDLKGANKLAVNLLADKANQNSKAINSIARSNGFKRSNGGDRSESWSGQSALIDLLQFEGQSRAISLGALSLYRRLAVFVRSNTHLCNLCYLSSHGLEKTLTLNRQLLGRERAQLLQESKIVGRRGIQALEISMNKQQLKNTLQQRLQHIVNCYQQSSFGLKQSESNSSLKESQSSFSLKLSQQACHQKTREQITKQKMQKADYQQGCVQWGERLYALFKSLCICAMNLPELVTLIKDLTVTVGQRPVKFMDFVVATLQHCLPLFCQFYTAIIKSNCGFVRLGTTTLPFSVQLQLQLKMKLLVLLQQQANQHCTRYPFLTAAIRFAVQYSEGSRLGLYRCMRSSHPDVDHILSSFDQFYCCRLIDACQKSIDGASEGEKHADRQDKYQISERKNQFYISERQDKEPINEQNRGREQQDKGQKRSDADRQGVLEFSQLYSLLQIVLTKYHTNSRRLDLQKIQTQTTITQTFMPYHPTNRQEQINRAEHSRRQEYQNQDGQREGESPKRSTNLNRKDHIGCWDRQGNRVKQQIDFQSMVFVEVGATRKQQQGQLHTHSQLQTNRLHQDIIDLDHFKATTSKWHSQYEDAQNNPKNQQCYKRQGQPNSTKSNQFMLNTQLISLCRMFNEQLEGREFLRDTAFFPAKHISKLPNNHHQTTQINHHQTTQINHHQTTSLNRQSTNSLNRQQTTEFRHYQTTTGMRGGQTTGLLQAFAGVQNHQNVQSDCIIQSEDIIESDCVIQSEDAMVQSDCIIQSEDAMVQSDCIIQSQDSRLENAQRIEDAIVESLEQITGREPNSLRNILERQGQMASSTAVSNQLISQGLSNQGIESGPSLTQHSLVTASIVFSEKHSNPDGSMKLFGEQAEYQSTQEHPLMVQGQQQTKQQPEQGFQSSKNDILRLIQEYTLNPEVIKQIALRIKYIKESQLRALSNQLTGEVADLIGGEIRSRGLATYQHVDNPYADVFVDESRFYDRLRVQVQKEESHGQLKIPLLNSHFARGILRMAMYSASRPQEKEGNNSSGQGRNKQYRPNRSLPSFLRIVLLEQQNIRVLMREVLFSLSLGKTQFQLQWQQSLTFDGKQTAGFYKQVIVNDIMGVMLEQRIALPLLFFGKWHSTIRQIYTNTQSWTAYDSSRNKAVKDDCQIREGILIIEIVLRAIIQGQQASFFVTQLTQYISKLRKVSRFDYPYYPIQNAVDLSPQLTKLLCSTMHQRKTCFRQQPRDTALLRVLTFLSMDSFQTLLSTHLATTTRLVSQILAREHNAWQFFKRNYLVESAQIERKAEIYWQLRKSRRADQWEDELSLCRKILTDIASIGLAQVKQHALSLQYRQQETEMREQLSSLTRRLGEARQFGEKKALEEQLLEKERVYNFQKIELMNQLVATDIVPLVDRLGRSFKHQMARALELLSEVHAFFRPIANTTPVLFKQSAELYQTVLAFELMKVQQEQSFYAMSSLRTIPCLVSSGETGGSKRRLSLSLKSIQNTLRNIENNVNIDQSDKDINSSAKNINSSAKNIDCSFKNIDRSVKNIDRSVKNMDSSVKNMDSSVKNMDSSVKVIQNILHLSQNPTQAGNSQSVERTVKNIQNIQATLRNIQNICNSMNQDINLITIIKTTAKILPFESLSLQIDDPVFGLHAKHADTQSKLRYLKQNNSKGEKVIEISRESVWAESAVHFDASFGDYDVKIKFKGEIGLDYGGVTRQWATLLTRQITDPRLGLFQLNINQFALQPSRHATLVPEHLDKLRRFGVFVGKAMKEGWQLDLSLTKSFLKHMLGAVLYVQDLEDLEPDTARSLLWILNNEVGEQLGLLFTCQQEMLGSRREVQLVPGGAQVAVNEQNKKEYVKRMALAKMTESIREQSLAFLEGLQKVIPAQTLRLFNYKQIGRYLAGTSTIDVLQMKKTARIQGFKENEESVMWFWEIMQGKDQQWLSQFLFYLTAAYKVPYSGFTQRPITLNKMAGCLDYLPVAHTCFSIIDLSGYSSKQKMQALLETAVAEGKGFTVS